MPNNTLMAVSVKTEANFEFGVSQGLFPTRVFGGSANANAGHMYAPSRDGQRFLIQSQTEAATNFPVTFVLNRAAGLSRR